MVTSLIVCIHKCITDFMDGEGQACADNKKNLLCSRCGKRSTQNSSQPSLSHLPPSSAPASSPAVRTISLKQSRATAISNVVDEDEDEGGLVLASKRARVQRNDTGQLQTTEAEKLSSALSTFLHRCPMCWMAGLNEDSHSILRDCAALASLPEKAEYAKYFQPKYYGIKPPHCFKCHLPLIPGLEHPKLKAGMHQPCPHEDILKPIAFYIFYNEKWRTLAQKEFHFPSNKAEFLRWVVEQAAYKDGFRFTNYVRLMLWTLEILHQGEQPMLSPLPDILVPNSSPMSSAKSLAYPPSVPTSQNWSWKL
jgi:hypothetical protein